MANYILSIWYKVIMVFFRFLPLKNDRIVFSCFYGKGFGDSAKNIANELMTNGRYEVIWLVKKPKSEKFPTNIKVIKTKTLKELYCLSTAKVWVDNSRKPYGIMKRKNQYYIQTWHSSLRLKKIEKDAEKMLEPIYIRSAKNDSKMIDIITSGCRFSTNLYKKSFWYDGEVYECGTPRCDLFFDEKKKQLLRKQICDLYNIDASKKIVLYAPTFRKNKVFDDKYLDCDEFSEMLGDDFVVLLRLHPHMSESTVKNKCCLNVTKYPDMQELLCAADFLITDYSGCCFDMMIAKKPCILYTPDLEEYLKNERDLYFSFDELPFDKVDNMNELVKNIKNFDYKKYSKNIQQFGEKIGLCEDGKASERIAKLIIDKCKGKNE